MITLQNKMQPHQPIQSQNKKDWAISRHKHHSPKGAPYKLNETKQDQADRVQYRRSPRVPRVTAKYLESIQAELRDSDDE